MCDYLSVGESNQLHLPLERTTYAYWQLKNVSECAKLAVTLSLSLR